MYVVMDDGEIYGPFNSAVDAEVWGSKNCKSSGWYVWELRSPF